MNGMSLISSMNSLQIDGFVMMVSLPDAISESEATELFYGEACKDTYKPNSEEPLIHKIYLAFYEMKYNMENYN